MHLLQAPQGLQNLQQNSPLPEAIRGPRELPTGGCYGGAEIPALRDCSGCSKSTAAQQGKSSGVLRRRASGGKPVVEMAAVALYLERGKGQRDGRAGVQRQKKKGAETPRSNA